MALLVFIQVYLLAYFQWVFQFSLFSRRTWHFPDRAFHQLFLENWQ